MPNTLPVAKIMDGAGIKGEIRLACGVQSNRIPFISSPYTSHTRSEPNVTHITTTINRDGPLHRLAVLAFVLTKKTSPNSQD